MNEERAITEDAIEPPKEKKLSGAQRKQDLRRGTLVKLAMRKPPQPKPLRRTPDVQIARGPVASNDYRAIRQAFKRRTSVQYQGRWYRVATLRVNDVGNFEAKLVEVV